MKSTATADLMLLDARVVSRAPNAPGPFQAIGFAAGDVCFLGSNAEARRLIGPATEVRELRNALVLPGFMDNHVHLTSWALRRLGPDWSAPGSLAEFVHLVAEQARSLPPGTWITGGGWNETAWPEGRSPTRADLDPASEGHPVFLRRCDGHVGAANSRALELAGITASTVAPPGGEILRFPDGSPSGILTDEAMAPVMRRASAPGRVDRLDALRRAQQAAHALGLTAVCDMCGIDDLELYAELAQAGELTLRIVAYPYAGTDLRVVEEWRRTYASLADRVKVEGLKYFADGSLGARTAAFFTPYRDRPGTTGLLMPDFDGDLPVLERMNAADIMGLQAAIHAIGDRGVARALDALEALTKRCGVRNRRPRIEHAQHVRAEDLKRFRALGAIASMQPRHMVDDGPWVVDRIGRERSAEAYAFRRFAAAGTPLTFGSDAPVASIDPLDGLRAAVFGRGDVSDPLPSSWQTANTVDIHRAVDAYTRANAFAARDDARAGTLAPGKRGDAAALSRDIVKHPESLFEDARVVMTVAAGRIVFEDGDKKN